MGKKEGRYVKKGNKERNVDSPALLEVQVPPGSGEPPLPFSVQKAQKAHMSAAHHHSNTPYTLSSAHTETSECIRDALLIELSTEDTRCPLPSTSLLSLFVKERERGWGGNPIRCNKERRIY